MIERENKIIVWKAKHGWRWKAMARNNECVATCAGQHYDRKSECLERVHLYGPAGWPVEIKTPKRRAD